MKTTDRNKHSGIAKLELDELRQKLQDRDLNERLRAVGELEQTGKQALPILLDTLLLSADSLVQRAAELAVVRMGEKDWAGLFTADTAEWRCLAEAGHPVLEAALGSVYAQRRLMSAFSDGGTTVPESLLTAFFKSPCRDTEALALAFTLSRGIKGSPEFEAFMDGVRMRTINACAKGLTDADAVVRHDSAAVFAAIAGDEAKRGLLQLLKGGSPQAINAVLQALAVCESPMAAQAVVNLLGAPEAEVREAAARTLEASGDRGVVPALVAALQDADLDVFTKAVQALSAVAAHDALPSLIGAMLTHAGPEHRRVAIRALAAIGGNRAIAALKKSAAEDPCPQNRMLADGQIGILIEHP